MMNEDGKSDGRILRGKSPNEARTLGLAEFRNPGRPRKI
jgi:hypothetical protein